MDCFTDGACGADAYTTDGDSGQPMGSPLGVRCTYDMMPAEQYPTTVLNVILPFRMGAGDPFGFEMCTTLAELDGLEGARARWPAGGEWQTLPLKYRDLPQSAALLVTVWQSREG
eukprot:2929769-Pyramimonas_sp.AAC.1